MLGKHPEVPTRSAAATPATGPVRRTNLPSPPSNRDRPVVFTFIHPRIRPTGKATDAEVFREGPSGIRPVAGGPPPARPPPPARATPNPADRDRPGTATLPP